MPSLKAIRSSCRHKGSLLSEHFRGNLQFFLPTVTFSDVFFGVHLQFVLDNVQLYNYFVEVSQAVGKVYLVFHLHLQETLHILWLSSLPSDL